MDANTLTSQQQHIEDELLEFLCHTHTEKPLCILIAQRSTRSFRWGETVTPCLLHASLVAASEGVNTFLYLACGRRQAMLVKEKFDKMRPEFFDDSAIVRIDRSQTRIRREDAEGTVIQWDFQSAAERRGGQSSDCVIYEIPTPSSVDSVKDAMVRIDVSGILCNLSTHVILSVAVTGTSNDFEAARAAIDATYGKIAHIIVMPTMPPQTDKSDDDIAWSSQRTQDKIEALMSRNAEVHKREILNTINESQGAESKTHLPDMDH